MAKNLADEYGVVVDNQIVKFDEHPYLDKLDTSGYGYIDSIFYIFYKLIVLSNISNTLFSENSISPFHFLHSSVKGIRCLVRISNHRY